MAKKIPRILYRKAKKVGNSAGVLLPKALLDSYVKVVVMKPPIKLKEDIMRFLEPYLEDILGIYNLPSKGDSNQKNPPKVEVIAISTDIRKTLSSANYHINIVPLSTIKSDIKQSKEFNKKISKAKVIINKKLLSELIN